MINVRCWVGIGKKGNEKEPENGKPKSLGKTEIENWKTNIEIFMYVVCHMIDC